MVPHQSSHKPLHKIVPVQNHASFDMRKGEWGAWIMLLYVSSHTVEVGDFGQNLLQ